MATFAEDKLQELITDLARGACIGQARIDVVLEISGTTPEQLASLVQREKDERAAYAQQQREFVAEILKRNRANQ